MNKERMYQEFAELKSREDAQVITDTCIKSGYIIYILAMSEVYENINVNKEYSARNHDYHRHSDAYLDNMRNIVARYKKLISPEIEIDRKNGSNIDGIVLLSNFAEVTNDASVFKEINVLPIILDKNETFNSILKDYKRLFNDLEKAGFTGSKRTGMHFHLSQDLCPNMTETAHLLSTLTKEQLLLYFGRRLNYGYDTQEALCNFYNRKYNLSSQQINELTKQGFTQRQVDKIVNSFNIANFKQCRTHTAVLHFSDFNTWEFRACKGTTNFTTFSERLKIVLDIFTKQRVPKKVNDFKSVREMADALALIEENNR